MRRLSRAFAVSAEESEGWNESYGSSHFTQMGVDNHHIGEGDLIGPRCGRSARLFQIERHSRSDCEGAFSEGFVNKDGRGMF
jgi:hypothetical protein